MNAARPSEQGESYGLLAARRALAQRLARAVLTSLAAKLYQNHHTAYETIR
jgi:hypothetical protein